MPTGDSLSFFLGLLFFAAGTAVTAYTVDGTKRRNLLICAGIFLLLSLAWLAFPVAAATLGSPAELVQRLLLLVPLLTVILVAVIVKDRSPPKMNELPVFVEKQSPAQRLRELGKQAHRAISQARLELRADSSKRGAEKSFFALRALMLTLSKEVGIRFPKETTNPLHTLESSLRVMERIAPLLEAGHDEEARQAAAEWSDRLDAAAGQAEA